MKGIQMILRSRHISIMLASVALMVTLALIVSTGKHASKVYAVSSPRNLTVTATAYTGGVEIVDNVSGNITQCVPFVNGGGFSSAVCGYVGTLGASAVPGVAATGTTSIYTASYETFNINNATGAITTCNGYIGTTPPTTANCRSLGTAF